MEGDLFRFHEVCYGKTGTSGYSCRAMNKYFSFLITHFGHPFVMISEVLFDLLFGEILYLIDFVLVIRIFEERGVKEKSADADGSDSFFFENLFGSGCVLVAEKDILLDLIYLGKLMEAIGFALC